MIDVTSDIVKLLSIEGVKVYPEIFITKDTKLPCITYNQYDNSSHAEGDTLAYSNIVYHIKVWSTKIADLINYSVQIDSIMREAGYVRTNMLDTCSDSICQRDLKYKALAKEEF